MSNEHQYLSLLKTLVNKADKDLSIRDDRTGTGTYSLFGTQLDFDLSNMKVPILTTKSVPFKTILHELYWMYILKNPNTNYLDNNNVKIWREWSIVSKNNEPTIGEMYGQILRNFKYNFYDKDSHDNFDQIQYVIDLLKDKPNTRRAVFTTFDPRAIADERLSFEQNVNQGRGVLNPCFTKGHFVQLENGEYKDISKIKIGDKVLTQDESFQLVSNTFKTKKDCIYNLKIYKTPEIFTTEEHPFYVESKGWVKAKDLQVGDYLQVSPINDKSIIPNIKITIDINQYKTQDYVLNFSEDFMFFLGYFLGNGNLNSAAKTRIKLSVPVKKIELIENNLKKLNINYHIFEGSSDKQKNIIFSHAIYSTFIRKYLPGDAYSKFIPQFILDLPVKLLKELLNGYIEADGYKRKNTFRITTVSPSLAYGISKICHKVGYLSCGPLFQKRPKTTIIENRVVNQRDTYSIEFSINPQKSKFKNTSKGLFYKLENIEIKNPENYDGYVYNITVENNHTYTINNIVTHNCHGLVNQLYINDNNELEMFTFQRLKERPNTVMCFENLPKKGNPLLKGNPMLN